MKNIYWKHFIKILRHKYFVFICGIELNVSLWQLVIHDLSKFYPAEFIPYAKYWESGQRDGHGKVNFDRAFLHHLHHNPHHYEHWLLHGNAVPMPEKYALEMIADWGGAGMAYSGRFDLKEWLAKNWGRISPQIHPQTREFVSKTVAAQYGIIIPC